MPLSKLEPKKLEQLFSMGYELIIVLAISFSFGFCYIGILGRKPEGVEKYCLYLCILFVLQSYYSYCWMTTGQSLAQRAWGLTISIRDQNLSLRTSVLRFTLSALLNLSLVSIVFLILGRSNQLIQDRLIGTLVQKNSKVEKTT